MISSLRKLARPWAVVFILANLLNVLAPTISWALTSGPTAPEATSFEPVDTTNIVDMLTGDMTYNIPLLEVPGPAGSYPLSLSYHAGIMPGEEASWVGLGWTLNPGAITRNVNGYPDDFSNVGTYNRVYWAGGQRDTYSYGISVGIKGLVSVGAGLQVSYDTYRGTGRGGYLDASVGFKSTNLRASATVGISPYGGAYASVGLGLGIGIGSRVVGDGLSANLSVGITTNFNTTSLNGGVGVNIRDANGRGFSGSLLGASISTGGDQVTSSLSLGGGTSNVNNSKVGQISTSESGFSIDIPIYIVNLSYSQHQVRYWMDQTERVAVSGVLYNPTPQSEVYNATSFNNYAFDTYTLPEFETTNDPNKAPGPSFFNYDNYSVNAQGIAGNMRPYLLKDLIFRQNRIIKKDNKEEIIQYHYSGDEYRTGKKEFRFINDFSNKHQTQLDSWVNTPYPLVASYGTATSGESGNTGLIGNKLFGSRNIEWYTNTQIRNNQDGDFIDCNATGFNRLPTTQIGGFKITNESGVTYHFALPAYAYDEYEYSENIKFPDGKTFNEFKKREPYAYTWYLTAITGPDYVDRGGQNNGSNGIVDSSDWGYWVAFDYGKWSNNFPWRNPEVGFIQDIDNNFQNYSSGKKSIT
jgi:hypothetical protein